MARSKAIEHYPEEYLRLVERVGEELGIVEMPEEDKVIRMKTRAHFYAFVGALRKAAQEAHEVRVKRAREENSMGKALTPENPNAELYMRLGAVVDKVMITLTDTGLIFQRREQSWQAKKMRKALEASGTHAGMQSLVDPAAMEKRFMEKFMNPQPEEPEKPLVPKFGGFGGVDEAAIAAKASAFGFGKKN